MMTMKFLRLLFICFVFESFQVACNHVAILWLNDAIEKEEALFIAKIAARDVFNRSFTAVFKDIPLDLLHASSFESFLKVNYDDMLDRLNRDPEHCFFAVAPGDDDQVMGFALFVMSFDHREAYVRLIAVDPACQSCGIGKAIIFSILSRFPEIRRICLLTRLPNIGARKFYEHLGFVQCPCAAVWGDEVSPERFIGYEWVR